MSRSRIGTWGVFLSGSGTEYGVFGSGARESLKVHVGVGNRESSV